MVTIKVAINLFITAIALIAISHTIFQLSVFGTGISGFFETGISGLSIDDSSGSDSKQNNAQISTKSLIILFSEWLFLIAIITFTLIKGKIESKNELSLSNIKEKYEKGENRTDLDILYDILKEKKHLSLNSISKIFKVSKEVAKSWSETLEAGDLATLFYPRIGDPELVLKK